MAMRPRYYESIFRLCVFAGVVICASMPLAAFCQQPSTPAENDPLQDIRALLKADKLAESEKALRAYLSDHINSADAHFLLGYILFREQRAKDSLAEFTEGARFRRPAASDLKIVAADYVFFGDYADADKWLSAVTRETPEDAEAWYLLGRAKNTENLFAEGIACFQHVLALLPDDVRAEDNLGLSYQGLNRVSDARAAFETAISWQKDSLIKDAQPYLNLGILLMDQNQPTLALPHLEQAAALAPRNPKVHEELGRAYESLKMLDKAQYELEQAIALAPNASGLHFRLGQIYRRQGMQQRAQQEFDMSSKLYSSRSSIETPNPAAQN